MDDQIGESGNELPKYFISYTDTEPIGSITIILEPDGTQWLDGNLFLHSRALEYPRPSDTTLQAEASNLTNFRNTLLELNIDYLKFDGREFERPTYIYKASFRFNVETGEIGVETANNKIRTVIRFYKWMMGARKFEPRKKPWRAKVVHVTTEDQFGVLRTRMVTTTDLVFRSSKDDTESYIQDGGKLRPLEKNEQHILLETLIETENTEMWLIFLIGYVTGMRIQSILTLRLKNIIITDENDRELYPIIGGRGLLVDTKRAKRQQMLMPGWLHHRIDVYLNSKRYLIRKSQAHTRPDEEQYVFLTKSGKPYYVSEADKIIYSKHEKGSAIRLFIRDILKPNLSKKGHSFSFRFHDLRATFGTNLVEERKRLLHKGEIGMFELMDYISRRMNHNNPKTTMRYINYKKIKDSVHNADADFQDHVLELIKKERNDNS